VWEVWQIDKNGIKLTDDVLKALPIVASPFLAVRSEISDIDGRLKLSVSDWQLFSNEEILNEINKHLTELK
jgi:hypothetical protein